MSFLGKLLTPKSAKDLLAEAARRRDAGDLGAAKVAIEDALRRASDDTTRAEASAALLDVRDRIASARLAQAEHYLGIGDEDLAREETEGAIQMAASEAVRAQAVAFRRRFEEDAAVERATAAEGESSREERFAALAGSWEEEQSEEYERLGRPLEDTLMAIMALAERSTAMHGAAVQEAAVQEAAEADALRAEYAPHLTALRGLLAEHAADAVYLHFELGRAAIAAGHTDEGKAALRTFLAKLPAGHGGESRLLSHLELARLEDAAGNGDAAIAEFELAIESMEEDPRPFLALGQYLRTKGHAAEAVDVIKSALAVMGEGTPNWRVLEELGLAEKDAGNAAGAVENLEKVVEMFTSRRVYDPPRESALALAELYEAGGRPARAADMYRMLAEGSHRAEHVRFLREAARLLGAAGLGDEADRMRRKALAVAEARGDAAALAALQAELGQAPAV